ncbi:hypothetical protein BW247_04985 [Acidihalobacter ferrooxydans]|uniref:Type I restriction modification DNA specificity domain-containing protein n=2 Tax=Acidihalobacter ferrooxydans TaxID=1765967 RepID=A0A1P8UFB2_9GAMM|nr:hypothetical protein BW247_04985 [Acidihalobacter ferrooxydans]
MPKINREALATLRFPLPPVCEQSKIIDYLTKKTHDIDYYSQAIRESISLLKERRSALITAAVTGQIDPKEMAA